MRKLLSNKHITNSGLLVFALMFANGMNFLFNAYLGRVLDFESFGLITLITSLWYLITIPLNSLAGTANYMIAFVNAKSGKAESDGFFNFLKSKSLLIITIGAALWLLASPLLASFFQVNSVAAVASLSAVIIFGALTLLNRAFLQGNFLFVAVAVTVIIESLVKFLLAIVFTITGYGNLSYLSIPISLILGFLTTKIILAPKLKNTAMTSQHAFPKQFFFMALLTSLASTAFLTFDVIIVKHFFDPHTAGVYALLSLVGKMVFFLGSLLNGIVFTYISHESGKAKQNKTLFYKLFGLCAFMTTGAFILLGPLGHLVTPILFGQKAISIFPYLTIYSFAMALFTLSSIFVSYHLIRKQFSFAYISVLMALFMCLGIILFHASILQVSYVILAVSILSFTTIVFWHLLNRNKTYDTK